MNAQGNDPHPVELRNHRKSRCLEISWSDGITAIVPHRVLREACRCAHCLAANRSGQPVSADAAVCLDAVEAYGSNALRLVFDDGHGRGLYPFAYLRELPVAGGPVRRAQQENVLANPSSSSGVR